MSKTHSGPDALRVLLDRRTPGPWRSAYWPLPEPHYWVGVLPEGEMYSRMDHCVGGPIMEEADADLMGQSPLMAELLLELHQRITQINGEGDYCYACDEHPSHGHAEDCPLVRLGEIKTAVASG